MGMFNSIRTNIKNNLIAGIILVVPLVMTIFVVKWLIDFFDNLIKPFTENYIHIHVPGLGFLLSVIFIYLVGLLTKNYFGNKIIQYGEQFVVRIPFVKSIYTAVKQIVTSLTNQDKKKSGKVVMIEYPSPGRYSLGLFNGQTIISEDNITMGSVLILTSINPTSGFAVLVPENEIKLTSLTVEQMMKFVVSGGMVIPPVIHTTKEVNLSKWINETTPGE
jgi:uncharacterized membrane protein